MEAPVPGIGEDHVGPQPGPLSQGYFKRIQFTSDLLPSDIVGISVFNRQKQAFEFMPGPLFANIVLADEVDGAAPAN